MADITAPGLLIWATMPKSQIAVDSSTQLKLSLMLSPRLVIASAGATVDGGEFPHFDDWPATAANLSFKVEIGGSPAQVFDAALDTSLMDSAAWKALFGGLPVDSHVPGAPALRSRDFISYPVGVNYRNIVGAYRPEPEPLPSAPVSAQASRHAAQLNLAQRLGVTPAQRRELRTRLQRMRRSHGVVTADRIAQTEGVSIDALHFEQLSEFFDGLAKGAQRRHAEAQPAPPPAFDFHRAVTVVARYPALMRKLALVLDLTVTADSATIAALPANGLVRVRLAAPVDGWQSFTPWTRYSLDRAGGFFPESASEALGVAAGMLFPLDTDTKMGLDLDAIAPKIRHTLSQFMQDAGAAQGLKFPASRSGGLALARDGLADTLRRMLDRQAVLEDGLPAALASQGGQTDFQLATEDLLRGFRVDIRRDGDPRWLSLNQRQGNYNLRNGALVFDAQDEGFINLQAFNPDSDSATALYAHETLFRWAGWSLSAPRPGNTIGPDGSVIDPAQQATSNVPLQVKFAAVPGSLPRLRFGAGYDCRLRVVDLAGNSIPLTAATPNDFVFRLGKYLRFDPVIAPTLLMRDAARPAESVDNIVIRSDIDAPAAETSERLVAPPKTSVQMAEWHGMFDTTNGVDTAAYPTLRDLDGSLPEAPYGAAPPTLPYLPEPIARGASFRVPTPLTSPQLDPVKIAFDGAWPGLQCFRLLLKEGSDAPSWDAAQRLFTVSLAKGRSATYELASYIDAGALAADPANDQVKDLALFDYWNSIEDRPSFHPDRPKYWAEVVAGRNEQLTPHRIITLVHAVPRPLAAPVIDVLHAGVVRNPDDTSCTVGAPCTVDVASTGQVELLAEWDEPVDDGINPPSRRAVRAHVGRRSLDAALGDGDGGVSMNQEFHDSKHRRVTYSVVATTRYGEYFPEIQDAAKLTQVSAPLTLDMPCSARPAPPKVLYVMPTFGWQDGGSGASPSRQRRVGLRVYLDRPWYSSGDGERLGVRMAMRPVNVPPPGGNGNGGGERPPPGPWPSAPTDIVPQPPQDIPEYRTPFVTQWGVDPAFVGDSITSPFGPLPGHFPNARSMEFEMDTRGVTLGDPQIYTFAHATFDVAFEPPDPSAPDRAADPTRDPHNGRWYCDIEIDAGTAYFPFLRLALVRFQPSGEFWESHGLIFYDMRFSEVALADFALLAPGRNASIVPDATDANLLHVTVTGPSFIANEALGDLSRPPPALAVGVDLNVGNAAAPLWIPMTTADFTNGRDTSQGVGATLWRGDIRLPLARGSQPMRLTIKEYEILPADALGGDIATATLARRLVYADTLAL